MTITIQKGNDLLYSISISSNVFIKLNMGITLVGSNEL